MRCLFAPCGEPKTAVEGVGIIGLVVPAALMRVKCLCTEIRKRNRRGNGLTDAKLGFDRSSSRFGTENHPNE